MGEAGRGTYEAPRLGVRFRPSRERTGACPFCLLHSLPALPAMNRFHTLAAALAATLLASCGDTSNAAASASEAATASLPPGTGVPDAGNPSALGLHLLDPHQDGRASSVELVDVGIARLVELWAHDQHDQPVLVARDFAVGPTYVGDGVASFLVTQPVLGVDRLVIDADVTDRGARGGRARFLAAAESAAATVPSLRDAGVAGAGLLSEVPRNAALVLRFDDLLDVSDLARTAPRVLTGWPATTPHDARVVPDAMHGGFAGSSRTFATTRLLVDLAVRSGEQTRSHRPVGLSPLGLAASDGDGPTAELRLSTVALGAAPVVRNLSGATVGAGAGSVDFQSATLDIVRPFRAGSATGAGQGFLGDMTPPRLVARADVRIVDPPQQDPVTPDIFTLPTVRFAGTGCAAAAQVGDIIVQTDLLAEVIAPSGPPVGRDVSNVRVLLLEFPAGWTGPGQWVTDGVGPARYDAPYDPAMDDRRVACLVGVSPDPLGAPSAPTRGVSPDADVTIWFNEPIDPDSLVDQDAALLGRSALPETGILDAREIFVATLGMGGDMESIVSSPLLPLTHSNGTSEVYHVTPRLGAGAARDLAGNALVESPGPIALSIDPDAPDANTDGFFLRHATVDELGTGGFDVDGQLLFDLVNERVRPRPVQRFSEYIDDSQAIIRQMTPFPFGVQTPLNPLGAKLQALWRYADVGFGLTDTGSINVDVEGLSWAPVGGQVIADQYAEFEIALAHSRFAPDEVPDPASLFPRFQNSGMRSPFDVNVPADLSLETVHDRSLGYTVSPGDIFQAPTGTALMPYPLNRGLSPDEFQRYTWRDTTLRTREGPASGGVEPQAYLLAQNLPIPSTPFYRPGQVQTIGLPLLMEFRTFPDANALGVNALRTALAVNSSSRPYFRAFSAGGVDQSGTTVVVDPDAETEANGGFNPGSIPPGQATFGRDNSVYLGAVDFVVRRSVVHSLWIDAGDQAAARAFEEPLVAVAGGSPDTRVEVSLRGASSIVLVTGGGTQFENDSDMNGVVDYVEDANFIDLYGDYYNDTGVLNHDTAAANSGLTFVSGDDAWKPGANEIAGARYVQLRYVLESDPVTGEVPELTATGVAWTD